MPADFWRLWQGQLVSHLGNQAFQVMALFWLAQATGSAGAGAAYMALGLLPPVFLGPALARWAAWWPLRRVLVACDLLSAACSAPLVGALLLGADSDTVTALLLVSAVGLSLSNALFSPCLHSSVPLLVSGDKLPQANSWMMTTQQLAAVLGQGLGGIAYAVLGPLALGIANMAGFLGSGALAVRIKARAMLTPGDRSTPAPRTWVLLSQLPELKRLAIVSAVFNMLYAPWLVLLPFHLERIQGLRADLLGWCLAAYGAGNLLGALAMKRMLVWGGPKLLGFALVGQGAGLVVLGFAATVSQLEAVLVLLGVGIGLINVLIITRAQQAVPEAWRAPAMATLRATVHLATPVGYGLVALAQQALSTQVVYAGSGLLLILALLPLVVTRRSHL